MSASSLSSSSSDDVNLETFGLIWLDVNVNSNREYQFRDVINHLRKFADPDKCQRYIEQASQADRWILIVSSQLGYSLIPRIHQLPQVSSIYIHGTDESFNKQWTNEFIKIRDVISETDDLIHRIKSDYATHKIRMKGEEPLFLHMFTTNESAGSSTTGLSGQFVYSQILIDCLLRIKSNEIDKNEFISLCQKEYEGNQSQLTILDEFQHGYLPERVLWWYTRDSFFYRILNKALRTQNLDVLFLLRSYIFDIYIQLQKRQSTSLLHVYRSQLMSSSELESLPKYINQFISINSFFSASTNCLVADFYSGSGTLMGNLKQVLFEIDADSCLVNAKPFADISSCSAFPLESEVLFMPGSIFRLISIDSDDNHIWTVRMALCSDDDHDLKPVLAHIKKQNEYGETDLISLGKLLQKFGKFDLAEKYFHRLIKQISSNDSMLITVYERLGELFLQKQDLDIAVQWFQRASQMKEQIRSNNMRIHSTINTSATPFRGTDLALTPTAKWSSNGLTVAGGHGKGDNANQLYNSWGLCVHDDGTVYVADHVNHRIVAWSPGTSQGQVVVGKNGNGEGLHQLNWPRDVIVDQLDHDYIIICDRDNQRVVRWPRHGGTEGEILLSDIDCWGLTMDDRGFIYVSDIENHGVCRFHKNDSSQITWVAGRHGYGNALYQLNIPSYLFVDQDYSLYVSDDENHRVMKWSEGAHEGVIVAGGVSSNTDRKRLIYPRGVLVDKTGTVYVADSGNRRVTRWWQGGTQWSVVVGEKTVLETKQISLVVRWAYHLIDKVIFMSSIMIIVACKSLNYYHYDNSIIYFYAYDKLSIVM